MRYNSLALVAAAAATVSAQRPEDEPICDYYTEALLEENTAENQATLLTLIVNTVVIGNYTEPNVGVKVPGILAPGEVEGEKVELLPYFNGELATTNKGGKKGVKVNFLDDGGAEPLKKNKPANSDDSQQYFLLTHLYQFFGSLLGCSMQGMSGFDAYKANPSMFEVHKFMDLNYAEVTYFIQQVGLAAESFGVDEKDIKEVAEALTTLFNVRCAPPTEILPSQGKQLHSICIDEDTCPLAENAVCSAYEMEHHGNSTSSPTSEVPSPTSSTEPTDGSGSGEQPQPTGGAGVVSVGLGALVAGIAAFAL